MTTSTVAPRRRFWVRWRAIRLPRVVSLVEAALLVLGVGVFLLIGRAYAAPPLAAFDLAGLQLLDRLRSPTMDIVVEGITRLGAQWLWFIWPPIVVLLVLKHKLPSAAALAVVALGVYPWNDLLKSIFQRARPSGAVDLLSVQSFSFPSGHSMAAGAVFGMLALLAWRELSPTPRWRTPAMVICGLLMVLIPLSRVYLNVHYPTDVLAGLLVGILWADVVTLVWRVTAVWLRQRRTVTAST